MLSRSGLRSRFRKTEAYSWGTLEHTSRHLASSSFPCIPANLATPTIPRPRTSAQIECLKDVYILHVLFGVLGSFRDLVSAGQVCALWRRIAEDHPGFWEYVGITAAGSSSLAWATKRLVAGHGRPFCLYVDVPVVSSPAEKLFPLIAAQLPRLRSLTLRMDSIYALNMWAALQGPAPHLVCFEVQFAGVSSELDVAHFPLPPSVFDAWRLSGSRLKTMVLADVALALHAPLVAMPCFESVTLFYTQRAEFPWHLYGVFPNMRRLILRGCGPFVFTHPLVHPPDCRLQHVDAQLNGDAYVDVFSHIPIEHVPDVRLWNASEDAVYSALDGLRDPFQLLLLCETPAGDVVVVSLKSLRSGFVRRFAQLRRDYDHYPDCSPNALLENEPFAEQVHSLVVAVSLWAQLYPFLRPFATNIQELVVVFDSSKESRGLTPFPTVPIECPCLKRLVLEGPTTGTVVVDAPALAKFLRQLVPHRPVEIQLVRVGVLR